MRHFIIVISALLLLTAAAVYQTVRTDLTMTGSGIEGDPLGVDTTEIATQYDLTTIGGKLSVETSSQQTTTSTSLVNVTDLVFTPEANKRYKISGRILWETTNINEGIAIGISWPSAGIVNNGGYVEIPRTTANSNKYWYGGTTTNYSDIPSAPSANTTYLCFIEAYMETNGSISGDFQIIFHAETGGNSVSIESGSFLEIEEL